MPATMHRFKKKIVSAGKHNAVKNGSTREMEEVNPDRLNHWVESFNQMRTELGYQIPNPAVHWDEEGKVPAPVTISENGELIDPRNGKPITWRSDLNLGFWDKLFIDEDGDLAGEVEAPGDPADPNTPAGKLGTTIKHTSIGATKKYTDGTGKVWEDVLVHIASPVHPVEPNQKNFIPMDQGEFSLMSMSTLVGDYASDPGNTGETTTNTEASEGLSTQDPKEVLKLLKEIGIDLPEDTSQDNFIERLGLALRQRIADDKEHDENIMPKPPKPATPQKQPPNSIEKPGPGIVTMSNQAEQTASDLTLDITMSALAKQAKKDCNKRIDALVEMGALKPEQKEKLFGGLEIFTMSQADFDPATKDFKQSKFEFALDCIEAVLGNIKSSKGKAEPDEKQLTTMNSIFTDGYNPAKDVEHKIDLDGDGDGEAEAEDSPFIQGALSV